MLASAGVGSPSNRHRSMECSCAAERSFSSEACHFAMQLPSQAGSDLDRAGLPGIGNPTLHIGEVGQIRGQVGAQDGGEAGEDGGDLGTGT